jgi:AbiTii
MSLIEDIRTHILDPKFPMTSILREAMVLASKLRSDELTTWVQSELEGFRNDAEIPVYRKFRAQSIGSGLNTAWRANNVPLPTFILPDEMRDYVDNGVVGQGVRELESLLESKKTAFHKPWPDTLISYYNQLPQVAMTLVSACIVFPRGVIVHVLDTVRTRLLQFVLEIEELNPGAGTIPSLEQVSPAITHQIFEKVIMNENYHGDVQKFQDVYGSNIAIGQARISSSHASYTTTADATTAFEALKTHMDEVAEAERETVKQAISLLIAAIEDSNIPKSRVVGAAETIAKASDRMKRGLRDLSIGVTGSLAASGIWEGIRYAVGGGS